jgi:hypothetical protein
MVEYSKPNEGRPPKLLGTISRRQLTVGHEYARLFEYDHLPEELQKVSKPFSDLAQLLMYGERAGDPMVQMALIKLWEAKNLAVLAAARKY